MPLAQLGAPVRALEKDVDQHVEARRAELVEPDVERVLPRVGVQPDDLAHPLAERVDRVGRRAVRQAHVRREPPVSATPVVVNGRAHQRRVRHRHQRVVERADPGRPHAQVLDRALHLVDHHPVAHLERLIHDDRDGAEEVLDRVLGGEREREPADAQPRQQRQDLHVERLGDVDHPERRHERLEGLADQRDQQVVELGRGALRLARQERREQIDHAERRPHRREHQHDPHRDQQHKQRRRGQTQQAQRPEPQRRGRQQPERPDRLLDQRAVTVHAALVVDPPPQHPEDQLHDEVEHQAREDDRGDPQPLPEFDIEERRVAQALRRPAPDQHRGCERDIARAEVGRQRLDIAEQRVQPRDRPARKPPLAQLVRREHDLAVGQPAHAAVLGQASLGEVDKPLRVRAREVAEEIVPLDVLDPVEHLQHADGKLALQPQLVHAAEVEAREIEAPQRLVEMLGVTRLGVLGHRAEIREHRLLGRHQPGVRTRCLLRRGLGRSRLRAVLCERHRHKPGDAHGAHRTQNEATERNGSKKSRHAGCYRPRSPRGAHPYRWMRTRLSPSPSSS